MTARDASRYILDRVAKMLEEEGGPVGEAVKMIASAKRVFVYGVGRSGLVARAFAMRLTQLGLDSFFIGETITPIVKAGDLVVIVSNTGTTMSAVQTANIARRVGARVLAVTGNRHSKLSQAANLALTISEHRDARRSKFAPLGTLFETAALVLLDGMVADVMRDLGETEATMRGRHAIMV
ncbi:MAG TPA: SIS domain-containing protein [Thermoplasmata archaeon]|nr:SIS domain-containing protein [Thermoplasmata archaeon]